MCLKTMMNQDIHENKAGVTIKLCFNSKRFCTENRIAWNDWREGKTMLTIFDAEGMSDFLGMVLFVQLIKWLHKI